MKKSTILFAGLFAASALMAQEEHNLPVEVIKCTDFHITRPLSELFEEPGEEQTREAEKKTESSDRDNRSPQVFLKTAEDDAEYGNDPAYMQTTMGTRPSQNTKANWLGQSGGGYPPDPTGAVGPTNFVQSVNATSIKIYSKTGTVLGTISSLGSLWSPATGDDGDPIVMYDRYADRWFLSQFGQTGNKIYIAISTTNNPAGTYYAYTFTSSSFPDYLKFSIWQNGYYMTSNQGGRMYAFERDQMLLGNSASRAVTATFTTGPTSGFYCPLPADADGGLPSAGATLPFFSYSENAWGAGAVDGVKIWNMTVNWVPTTPTATISSPVTVATAAFDASYSSAWNDIMQPGTAVAGTITTSTSSTTVTGTGTAFTATLFPAGSVITTTGGVIIGTVSSVTNATTLVLTTNAASTNTGISCLKRQQMLDGIGGVATYRAQWRKWAGYNTVLLNWGIKISTSQRSIKWVELRQDQTTGVWSLYQQGTYTPDAKSRWVGSMAMDDNGSIALCYARSSGATGDYPSLAYTGRLATDPLGTMTFTETVAATGAGSQTGGINRFGDYSQTTLDPDGVTFWHTGEYMGGTTGASALRTRVYSFQLPVSVGIDNASQAKLTVYQDGSQLNVKGSNLVSNDEAIIDLFDMNGKQLSAQKVTPSGNAVEASFDISALASGTYLVRIARANTNFQKVTKVVITK